MNHYRPDYSGLNSGGGTRDSLLHTHPDRLWRQPSPLHNGHRAPGLFPGVKRPRCGIHDQPHLTPRLRMSGAIPSRHLWWHVIGRTSILATSIKKSLATSIQWWLIIWRAGLAEGYTMWHCTAPLDLTSGWGFTTATGQLSTWVCSVVEESSTHWRSPSLFMKCPTVCGICVYSVPPLGPIPTAYCCVWKDPFRNFDATYAHA